MILTRKGRKDTTKSNIDPPISYRISSLRVPGFFSQKAENNILITSCAAKKKKIRGPYRFQSYASDILPLTINEKLCDNPHEGHGLPVIFS
jgi:hypothetical protein